jgi:hypothetical protein
MAAPAEPGVSSSSRCSSGSSSQASEGANRQARAQRSTHVRRMLLLKQPTSCVRARAAGTPVRAGRRWWAGSSLPPRTGRSRRQSNARQGRTALDSARQMRHAIAFGAEVGSEKPLRIFSPCVCVCVCVCAVTCMWSSNAITAFSLFRVCSLSTERL